MATFTTAISASTVVKVGIVQGLGLGFIFVPLSTFAYATLETRLRTEATSFYSLMRNVGSSLGISIMVGLLTHNTQTNHDVLSQFSTPFNAALNSADVATYWSLEETSGLVALNNEITLQAATIAYQNDFRLMMFVTLLMMPLLLLFKLNKAESEPIL
jgi:DHA2 family multidrug resistance protein